jgi:uncharacterized DUF497 family protein
VPITFDPAKSEWNRQERGMPFTMAERFDFDTALVREDDRDAYPEPRFQALGKIGREVVFLVFSPTEDGFRVISLRRATKQERSLWLARHP